MLLRLRDAEQHQQDGHADAVLLQLRLPGDDHHRLLLLHRHGRLQARGRTAPAGQEDERGLPEEQFRPERRFGRDSHRQSGHHEHHAVGVGVDSVRRHLPDRHLGRRQQDHAARLHRTGHHLQNVMRLQSHHLRHLPPEIPRGTRPLPITLTNLTHSLFFTCSV